MNLKLTKRISKLFLLITLFEAMFPRNKIICKSNSSYVFSSLRNFSKNSIKSYFFIFSSHPWHSTLARISTISLRKSSASFLVCIILIKSSIKCSNVELIESSSLYLAIFLTIFIKWKSLFLNALFNNSWTFSPKIN